MQPYFMFNSSGTEPDFGTGLNSLDWGKAQAGPFPLGTNLFFLFAKKPKCHHPRAASPLVASPMWVPRWAEFSQLTKTGEKKNSKMPRGILQLSQKILGKGRITRGQTKAAFSRIWGSTGGRGNPVRAANSRGECSTKIQPFAGKEQRDPAWAAALKGLGHSLVEPPLAGMLSPFISLQIFKQKLSFNPRLKFSWTSSKNIYNYPRFFSSKFSCPISCSVSQCPENDNISKPRAGI